ncbi:MAG TPA: TROVE domain-containing protein [Streptosporangiaceae bacterium]|nr:TROVE domain-containing protein [Streptosporangiaceae bacterium]
MSKFNLTTARPAGRGPLATEAVPSGRTHEGGAGYARDARSELFLRATASFAGEDSFYEDTAVRDDRMRELVSALATDADGFAWLQGFLPWLRDAGNVRTAPVLLAAEAVRARLAVGLEGGNRQLIGSVLRRADEPGEMLAYWTSRYGRAVPKPVKRGVADAVARLYDERAFLRYDSEARGFRFGDVIDLVHPSPAAAKDRVAPPRQRPDQQGDLFRWAITARHGRDEAPPVSLRAVRARWELARLAPAERHRGVRDMLDGRGQRELLDLAAAGQWEWLLSWLGETPAENGLSKAEQWRLILPRLGYTALIRNLRNLDEAGIGDEEAAKLAARIADPEQVRRSRQFPFRFLSAYLSVASLRWGHALEQALDAATANIPELPGRTLILVDTSASMGRPLSRHSAITMVQAAALFGLATAIRNRDRADLYGFADGQFRVKRSQYRLSLLKSLEAFIRRIGEVGYGTRIAEAVRATYRSHDRVMIITDMQTFPAASGTGQVGDVSAAVPARIPVYGFNLVGYRHSGMPAGHGNRHELGGLTDATFALIPNIEAGAAARWPWVHAAAEVQ